jgi:predicted permease
MGPTEEVKIMQTLWQDLRYGTRTLLKNPGFTLIAVMTLALGIGANTAIFSLTDQILIRSLPVERPEELVVLRSPGPKGGYVWSDGDDAASFSHPAYKDLRDRGANVFSGLLARFAIPLSVAGAGQTERADGELVSGNYFEVLGVRPALGRVFSQEDDRAPGAHQVVVLSHAYWTRRFGADPAILNKTLTVNGNPMTVIGVSREAFRGVQVGQTPDVFIPMMMKAQMIPNSRGLDDRNDYWLAVIGRLKPGMSPAQAEEAVRPAYRSVLEEDLAAKRVRNTEWRQRYLDKKLLLADGSNGRRILQSEVKQPFLLLTAMAGLALLIACANVANLLLARGAARQREIAVRMALGAGRWRLIRQFLLESLLLSLIGGVVGLAVAAWTIQGLVASIPPSAGAAGLSADLDPRLLGFTLALSALTGLLFGVAPAARATRLNLEATLREQGSGVSGGLSSVRFRKALVVSQIVLTTVLLVGAGLFARSLNNLSRLDLGLRADHLIAFSVAPELNGYSPQRTIALFDDLRQGIAALPGVRSVSAAELPILSDSTSGSNVTIQGYQAQENEDMEVRHNRIGPDYFATMGIPLISGREFTVADAAGAPKVAIINETMARRFFANRNPIGSRFAWGAGDAVRPDIEIVGVVKDSKHATVREERRPFAYLPYAQTPGLGRITFYARTDQDVASIAMSLRNEVGRRDDNLPIYDLKTFQQQMDESLFRDRFVTFLSICFGMLAAALAAIGLYGVMAYTVTRRIREIGIRIALGASQRRVAWLILREVTLLALAGLLAGAPLALALGRAAESLLFNVEPFDPLVFAAAILLLVCVALLGGYLPARRAARVDPMVALRRE